MYKTNFFSFKVLIEMIHPPDGGGGLQEERRVILLMVLELARSEQDCVEFSLLVHLSEDGSQASWSIGGASGGVCD